jgi:hypothetical protein
MEKECQISALISPTTRVLLDRQVRATGIKKGRLVEQALLHHLQALHELPADVIVRPRLVVTRRSGEQIAKRITTPPRPAKRLRALLKGNGN